MPASTDSDRSLYIAPSVDFQTDASSPAGLLNQLREAAENIQEELYKSGILRYAFAHEVLVKLPPPARARLLFKLKNFLDPQAERTALARKNGVAESDINLRILQQRLDAKKRILRELFDSDDSNELDTIRELENLPDLFEHGSIADIIVIMLQYPEQFSFQIAALLTQIPIQQLPEDVVNTLNPIITQSEVEIQPENGNWYLCSYSEPKLLRALEDGAVLLVNDCLVMKYIGKLAALCIKNSTTSNGDTFVRGMWYSPTDTDLRDKLRKEFDAGRGRIGINEGNWALMRQLSAVRSMSPEQILAHTLTVIEKIPLKGLGKIEGISREEYRKSHKEAN